MNGSMINRLTFSKGGRWDDYASTADDTQSVTSKGTTDMMTQAQVVRTQIERMERPVPPPLPVTPPQPPSPRGGSMYSNRYSSILKLFPNFSFPNFQLIIFNILFKYIRHVSVQFPLNDILSKKGKEKRLIQFYLMLNSNISHAQSIRSTATQVASSPGRAKDSRFIPNISGFGGVRPLFQDPARHVQPEQRHIRVPAASEGEPRVQKRLRQVTIVRSKVERLLWEGQHGHGKFRKGQKFRLRLPPRPEFGHFRPEIRERHIREHEERSLWNGQGRVAKVEGQLRHALVQRLWPDAEHEGIVRSRSSKFQEIGS